MLPVLHASQPFPTIFTASGATTEKARVSIKHIPETIEKHTVLNFSGIFFDLNAFRNLSSEASVGKQNKETRNESHKSLERKSICQKHATKLKKVEKDENIVEDYLSPRVQKKNGVSRGKKGKLKDCFLKRPRCQEDKNLGVANVVSLDKPQRQETRLDKYFTRTNHSTDVEDDPNNIEPQRVTN